MNLVEAYEKQPKILNLYKKTVVEFQEYLEENNIPEEKYYESVISFIETKGYTNNTKKGYRNRLRRFLWRNGID